MDSDPLKEKQEQDEKFRKDLDEKVNLYTNMLSDRMNKIRDHSKCFDLFWTVQINNIRMYKWKTIKKHVQYRVQRQQKFEQYTKIKLMKYLKAFLGYGKTIFLELVVKEIELAR